MTSCIAITLSAIMMTTSPPTNQAAMLASESICNAAESYQIHPAWLVSYLATENKDFRAFGTGSDTGLFQINLHWNGHRLSNPLDYQEQANAASEVIKENIRRFGPTWKGVAAYNSWNNVIKNKDEAHVYYSRWQGYLLQIASLWSRTNG